MKTEILTSSLSGASINIHNTRKATEDYIWDMHIHKECEICMMKKGKKIFYINDKKITIDEGDIIFVNENIPHKTENFKNSECFLMQCKNEYYATLTNANISCYLLRKDEDYAVFRKGDETNLKLKELFEHIYKENDEKNLNYEMFVKSYVMQVFAILYRCEILKDAVSFFDEKSINRILPALEYIENHYNENLNLQDVSKTLNVDKAHFCRLFKKATDTSFVQYLNFVRIQKAEKLLTETELSISEISHRVGFSSPTYFAETFRMIMNCTPRFYKKNKQ
ncbi:MAG: helix-turn-helix domain-containing protein [Ruminococcaceae bacterium]|nr:helix-turn-helix domain-containing protein [Oscillospiraceae bacterium]